MADLKKPDFNNCPLEQTLELIRGKWRIPVLCTLMGHKTLRYSEIQKKIGGITNIMLTKILRDFEASGLVQRIQYNEVPPHVEYMLTEHGRGVMSALHIIASQGKELRMDGLLSEECRRCHEYAEE
jgi:DNA-binding HxlR family transcriptional regulator